MFIITKEELEHMTEFQLRQLYASILADLASRGLSALDCPLTLITLENIRAVLRGKQICKPLAPRF
jgi:hypothetical protein